MSIVNVLPRYLIYIAQNLTWFVADNVSGFGEAFRDQVSCLGAADVVRHSHRARHAEALQVSSFSFSSTG